MFNTPMTTTRTADPTTWTAEERKAAARRKNAKPDTRDAERFYNMTKQERQHLMHRMLNQAECPALTEQAAADQLLDAIKAIKELEAKLANANEAHMADHFHWVNA